MRKTLSFAVLCLTTAVSMPAMAQNNNQPTYVNPMYVSPYGATAYTTQPGQAGRMPTYNNTAQPLPLEQMVAGKNAPSYNYNTNNVYTGYGGNMATRDAQANIYQNQYMASLQQQQQGQQGYMPQQNVMPYQQGGAFSQMYSNTQQQQQRQPPVRRVVKRSASDNPLYVPQRLFNPDQ